jgi:hypothetical protein
MAGTMKHILGGARNQVNEGRPIAHQLWHSMRSQKSENPDKCREQGWLLKNSVFPKKVENRVSVELPDAIQFLQIPRERVFQQPQGLSPAISKCECHYSLQTYGHDLDLMNLESVLRRA